MEAKSITAVEWLYETLWQQTDFSLPNNILEQAKDIEKTQQKYFFECGRNFQLIGEGTFKECYNETFNQ